MLVLSTWSGLILSVQSNYLDVLGQANRADLRICPALVVFVCILCMPYMHAWLYIHNNVVIWISLKPICLQRQNGLALLHFGLPSIQPSWNLFAYMKYGVIQKEFMRMST